MGRHSTASCEVIAPMSPSERVLSPGGTCIKLTSSRDRVGDEPGLYGSHGVTGSGGISGVRDRVGDEPRLYGSHVFSYVFYIPGVGYLAFLIYVDLNTVIYF